MGNMRGIELVWGDYRPSPAELRAAEERAERAWRFVLSGVLRSLRAEWATRRLAPATLASECDYYLNHPNGLPGDLVADFQALKEEARRVDR